MGHSFISYGSKEVRLNDSDIAVAIYMMCLAVSSKNELFTIALIDTVNDWVKIVNGAPPGMADFGFEEFEDRNMLDLLIDESLNQLKIFGDKIPKTFLNQQTGSKTDVYISDYPSTSIEQTLKHFKELLD